MKWQLVILVSCLASGFAELPLADNCDANACQLPNCRCFSTDTPGGLAPRDTPQFVTLTFDDGVNVVNINTYKDILYNRVNSNGCKSGTTFFINHEYTDYTLVNELYNNGFEISLHSLTHQTPQDYWRLATYDDMKLEFADQRKQMAHFANIPIDEIAGIRIPFLQMTGNASFQVMADYGLEYDASWPTITYMNTGLWPYTLDYASNQDCVIPSCPTASIPGVWVNPMISWTDLNGLPCSMVDACYYKPDLTDEEAWFSFIVSNFERHYLNNRAPFGFYVHQAFLSVNPAVVRALVRFLDLVNSLNDAFLVNSRDVVNWTKNPIPLEEYIKKPCRSVTPAPCPATTCPLLAAHNDLTYYVTMCTVCPRVYPWLGNPLGE